MIPMTRADGAVVCGVPTCGREIHLDRRSWGDAERTGGHLVRITCGDHDLWIEYRAPRVPPLRTHVAGISVATRVVGCRHCGEVLERGRKGSAVIHIACKPAYEKAQRAARRAGTLAPCIFCLRASDGICARCSGMSPLERKRKRSRLYQKLRLAAKRVAKRKIVGPHDQSGGAGNVSRGVHSQEVSGA